MAKVTFEKVNITYPGASTPTVKDLDLDIADGEFLVLVGPSGCGKSTTLRSLAGLEPTSGGRILIGDKDVTGLEPGQRDIAMVFQNYALYPHLTVAENMGFALKLQKLPKQEIRAKVEEAAEILGLQDYLERKPKDLSGGQRQRVAMGRAIVRNPQVFLMDEPLSNLDAKLRVSTRAQIVELQRRLGTTTVYVTHDQIEAMTMADRIAVLADGQLQQIGSPRELYDHPGNLFVAGFLGSPSMNLLRFELDEERAFHGNTHIVPPREIVAAAPSNKIVFGVRPEQLHLLPEGDPNAWLHGTTVHVEDTGSDCYLRAELPDDLGHIVARVNPEEAPEPDTRVSFGFTMDKCHWFDAETEEVIRP